MPFQSQAQQRFAFSTDQPWATQWADETDFARLPKRARRMAKRRKDAGTVGLAIPPHGPHALFNQPGEQGRKRGKRMKRRTKDVILLAREKATGAPGELISPGVRRIRGNLCNVHGRYGPCDKALSGKRKPAKGRKPPKATLTPEQRAAARDTQHQANIDSVAKRMADSDTGLSPSGVQALTAFATGEQPDAARAKGLVEMGLAEPAGDGKTYRMTPTGRAVVGAMQAGDYQRAIDAVSRGTDASARRGERLTARQARQQAAADKRTAAQAKREAVAARRGKKKPARARPTTTPAPAGAAPQASAAPKRAPLPGAGASVKPPTAKPAPKALAPAKADPAVAQARNLTAVGEATGLGDNLSNLDQFSQGTPLRPQDVDYLVSQGLLERASDGTPRQTTQGKALLTAAKKGDAQGAKDAQSRARDRIGTKEFRVYKDAAGRDRWLSITTSAYQDTDEEWISTKAIAKAVAVGDASGARGPLRYWHVPGMDIGDCDFQAAMGPGDRFLVESGTFRNKACADLGRTLADRHYQMSPGFLHGRDQPRAGVFDDIVIYERSAVPAGRAANRFTRFTLKEDRMLTAEKETELRGLLADQPDLLNTLLSQVDKTDKAAQQAGVTHKEAEQPPAWAVALTERIAQLEATQKAGAPPFVKDDAAPDAETKAEAMPIDETVVEDDGMGEPDGDENMLTPAECQQIATMAADAVVAKLAPLLNIEQKMQGHMADLKSALGGYATAKDDTAAKLSADVAALQAQVKEVAQGNLPESLFDRMGIGPYRPSEARVTPTPQDAKTIKEALDAAGGTPSNLTGMDADAYKLIYG